ncbi:MAG: hypothetical protein JWR80_9993 [Bradyrhizobium sp.]|nr:hypothetical protein [Bradyrhizobium sp.]
MRFLGWAVILGPAIVVALVGLGMKVVGLL